MNLADFAIGAVAPPRVAPSVIAILGTAMDAGKTETAAYLVRGLKSAGQRTGYIKVTGTGAGGDGWLLQDAGADCVLDFTDAGLPSTFRVPIARIEHIMTLLIDNMAARVSIPSSWRLQTASTNRKPPSSSARQALQLRLRYRSCSPRRDGGERRRSDTGCTAHPHPRPFRSPVGIAPAAAGIRRSYRY